MEEYQGKYLKNKETAPEEDGEVFDKELQQLFGEHYQDMSAVPVEYEQVEDAEEAEEKTGICWKALGALFAGVGLLFYMVMAGKIDTAYGVLFTSGVSAVCGYHLK